MGSSFICRVEAILTTETEDFNVKILARANRSARIEHTNRARLSGTKLLGRRSEKLGFEFFDFFGEHRHGFKEVANYAVVGNVEDGSFGIFVDGYDGL